jgi:hypothetical protein
MSPLAVPIGRRGGGKNNKGERYLISFLNNGLTVTRKKRGNNKYGAKGTPKCTPCRKKKQIV